MAKDQMVNFRAKPSELATIDALAQAMSMSRSDLIRFALRKLNAEKQAQTQTAVDTSCPDNQDLNCAFATWVKLPTGLSQCQRCGVRRSH